jgi:hypothetical protein
MAVSNQTCSFDTMMNGIGDAEPPPLSVTMRPLDEALEQWKELAGANRNATLFHTPAWAEVLRRAYRFRVFGTSDSRRAPQARHRDQPSYGRQVHGAKTRYAFPDLA